MAVHRDALLAEVLYQLEYYYDMVKEKGFAPVLDEWKALSCMLGESVEVTEPNRSFIGKAVDLDDNGNLLVQTERGIEKVLAGDVHVRAVQ